MTTCDASPVANQAGKGKTATRSMRLSDELWNAVRDRAEADGTTTSNVVRDALLTYLAPRKGRLKRLDVPAVAGSPADRRSGRAPRQE